MLGHGVAVSPVVTVEPRRRKFHKAITLSMPAPRAHSQGMINQYSGSAPTLRLLCSITGGTSRAQWEDVTGSTPLTFVNDCVSFTTTVSARFWLMDCRNIGDATKMATELYREAIHVPFIAKFMVFAKRIDPLEARLRVFCMTDDKEDKTLEYQEQFTEIAKSRDVEVLEGKSQYIEFVGNLVPVTKSGEQLQFAFRAFKENRLPFSVRVKDQHAEAVSRCLFMREPKVQKGEPPQQPICILNILLPDDIVSDTISLTDSDSVRRKYYATENFDYYRQDPRLADISNLLGDDWVDLANQLGLTTSEINVIKSEYPDSVAKQAQSMLRMWLSQSGNRTQANTLDNALRRIGREDIVIQCLNEDNRNQQIVRIKSEDREKYRLRDQISEQDFSKREDYYLENERGFKTKPDTFDKYSAEEKEIEPSDEEDDFNKTVPEIREQIVKRLSNARTIPASSQRVEIVQEISSIKRKSLVEDKLAEAQYKAGSDAITIITVKPTSKVSQEKKIASEDTEVEKTPSDSISKMPDEHKEKEAESRIDVSDLKTPADSDRRDSILLEEVTHRLESKKPLPKLIADEDPKSPKFSRTPPPSPADFIMREKEATTAQELPYPPLCIFPTTASTSSPQDDDESMDPDGFREYQLVEYTPTRDCAEDGLLPNLTENLGSVELKRKLTYTSLTKTPAVLRKRLASTEDLDNESIIVDFAVRSFVPLSHKEVIPTSPSEKGIRDSNKPEKSEKFVQKSHPLSQESDNLLKETIHSEKEVVKISWIQHSDDSTRTYHKTETIHKIGRSYADNKSPQRVSKEEIIVGRINPNDSEEKVSDEPAVLSLNSRISRIEDGSEENIINANDSTDSTRENEISIVYEPAKSNPIYAKETNIESFKNDDSASHYISDTGIFTRDESLTEDEQLKLNQPDPISDTTLKHETADFTFDAGGYNFEDAELTDAGMSPILPDESVLAESNEYFTDAATSPIDFSDSCSHPSQKIETSETGTSTDQVGTKDASNSPISCEDSNYSSLSEKMSSNYERKGSGDVKFIIKYLEEKIISKPPHDLKKLKPDMQSYDDEISGKMNEEISLRLSSETLAPSDDESNSISLKCDAILVNRKKSVDHKIAKLQQMFVATDIVDNISDIRTSPTVPSGKKAEERSGHQNIDSKISALQKISNVSELENSIEINGEMHEKHHVKHKRELFENLANSGRNIDGKTIFTEHNKPQFSNDSHQMNRSFTDSDEKLLQTGIGNQLNSGKFEIVTKIAGELYSPLPTSEKMKEKVESVEVVAECNLSELEKQIIQDSSIEETLLKTNEIDNSELSKLETDSPNSGEVEPPCIKIVCKPQPPVRLLSLHIYSIEKTEDESDQLFSAESFRPEDVILDEKNKTEEEFEREKNTGELSSSLVNVEESQKQAQLKENDIVCELSELNQQILQDIRNVGPVLKINENENSNRSKFDINSSDLAEQEPQCIRKKRESKTSPLFSAEELWRNRSRNQIKRWSDPNMNLVENLLKPRTILK
ncbi:hypothetical protein WA026_020662 [Henosepilachna vigintioctopunctata]|uniref:Death domain-containing protein n=1 Tax=Henosepilachna vigintioctopunctata TaxID=420089 RepID=A0AAW1UBN3_9CUCU